MLCYVLCLLLTLCLPLLLALCSYHMACLSIFPLFNSSARSVATSSNASSAYKRWKKKTIIKKPGKKFRHAVNLTLIIDVSGSMSGERIKSVLKGIDKVSLALCLVLCDTLRYMSYYGLCFLSLHHLPTSDLRDASRPRFGVGYRL